MYHRHTLTVPATEYVHRLGREGYFGHKHYDTPSFFKGAVYGTHYDLGLSASGDPEEQCRAGIGY